MQQILNEVYPSLAQLSPSLFFESVSVVETDPKQKHLQHTAEESVYVITNIIHPGQQVK